MDIGFTQMTAEKLWAGNPSKVTAIPYSKNMDTTIKLDGNVLIAGKSARYNALNNLLAQLMQVLSPENLRISYATDTAQEFDCYIDSPYTDILAIAEDDIETMRVIKRICGIVQLRHTVKRHSNSVTLLVLDEPSRLLTKINKAALAELIGVLSLGPAVNVYTVLLTSKCNLPKPVINMASVRICTCLDERSAMELTGSNMPCALSDTEHEVFVYQPNAYSARGVIPEVSSAFMTEMAKAHATISTEKGLKKFDSIILVNKEDE